MANQESNDADNDIFPRDQLEHYKLELTRLRTANERLTHEVDYLRQALAASLSKIPRIEGAASPAVLSETAAPRQPVRAEQSSLSTYIRYFSMASLMASPAALLVILMLGLICTFVFLAALYFLPNSLLSG